jgi:hypothetical protein
MREARLLDNAKDTVILFADEPPKPMHLSVCRGEAACAGLGLYRGDARWLGKGPPPVAEIRVVHEIHSSLD